MSRNRLVLLGIAVAAAAIVAVAAIAIGTGGSGSSSSPPAATTTTAPAAAASLAGIPQHGLELGNPSAPATVIEFVDLQCPYCHAFTTDTFPQVVSKYVKTGRVNVTLRGLHFIGPDSEKALRAVLAASLQNKGWNMLEALYLRQGRENSGWVTDAVLRSAGATVPGLNVDLMMRDRSKPAVTKQIAAADALATQLHVGGTPTFVVTRPPALPQQLRLQALDYGSFSSALDADLG